MIAYWSPLPLPSSFLLPNMGGNKNEAIRIIKKVIKRAHPKSSIVIIYQITLFKYEKLIINSNLLNNLHLSKVRI